MKPVDVHAHVCDEAFDADREDVLLRIDQQLSACICASYDVHSSERAILLAQKNQKIYASIGVHPENFADFLQFKCKLGEFLQEKKVVSIGEIGLDYHFFDRKTEEEIEKLKKSQKEVFIEQIRIANENFLPIEVHCRDAMEDCIEILKKNRPKKGLMHCFSGSAQDALELVDLGFSFSVGGIVTFKNGKTLQEVVKFLPLEKIMLETDCPYLSPEPFRGKRNEPVNVKYVADKIAKLKGVSYEEVVEKTTQNAIEMFNLKN